MQFNNTLKDRQLILLDDEGRIIASCDSIFPTLDMRDEPVFKHFPLVESIFGIAKNMKVNEPKLRFSKIETTFKELNGFYDFTFIKTDIDSREPILWTILDYTKLYEDYHRSQQERQELAIAKELLKSES